MNVGNIKDMDRRSFYLTTPYRIFRYCMYIHSVISMQFLKLDVCFVSWIYNEWLLVLISQKTAKITSFYCKSLDESALVLGYLAEIRSCFFPENSHHASVLRVLSWTSFENVKKPLCMRVCVCDKMWGICVFSSACVSVVCVVFWLKVHRLQCNGSAWQDGEMWKSLCICIRLALSVSVFLCVSACVVFVSNEAT